LPINEPQQRPRPEPRAGGGSGLSQHS
jgi:hypothetical protein